MTRDKAHERRRPGAHPMLRHDLLIARRSVAATLVKRSDWLFLPFASAVLLLWARDTVSGIAPLGEPAIAGLLGFGLSVSVQLSVEARVRYHAGEGVVADSALRPSRRRTYRATAFLVLALGLAALAAAIGLPRLPAFVGGFLGGLAVGQAALLVPRTGLSRRLAGRRGRAIRKSGIFAGDGRIFVAAAGAALATVAIVALLRPLVPEPVDLAILAGLALACFGYLASVDHGVVRFLALIGYGSWRSIGLLIRPAAVYAGVLVAAALPIGKAAALVAAALGVAMLLLLTARICAYRSHDKAQADLRVTIAIAALGLIGAAMPPVLLIALPALAIATLRSSAAATWRMA
jgi:hypothetical protein